MTYIVTAPLVIIPNADGTSGDGYFYVDATVPAGFNDERCKVLAGEGMLAKSADGDSNTGASDGVKDILADVGDDKAKAAEALAAEQQKDQPRKTLVSKLEAILEQS